MKEGQRFVRSVDNPNNSGDIVEITEVELGWVEYKIIKSGGLYIFHDEGDTKTLYIEDFKDFYVPLKNSIEKIT